MHGVGGTRLAGRQIEVARLRTALDDAIHGHAEAVFLRGESGAGKSRLLEEFAAIAPDDHVAVLSAAAIDAGEAAPLWPFREALRRFLRNPANLWARDALGPFRPQLRSLAPGIPWADKGIDQDAPQMPALDVVLQVLLALAEQRPLALLLDDMQWADQSSQVLLAYLTASLIDEPVLVVVAYRHSEAEEAQVHQLALGLQQSRRATVLALPPLDRAAVAELLPDENHQLVDLILAKSGGNAFFVDELVRSLRDHTVRDVPEEVRELIRTRVRSLDEPVKQILRALAIGDDAIPHQLLHDVIGNRETLLAEVRAAVQSGLVQVDADGEGYRLRHGIVKDVLVTDLLPGERLSIHRRFAEALDGSKHPDFRTASRLARHWNGACDWSRALLATRDAAEEAERVHGFAEAQEHWLGAVALLDKHESTEESRGEVLERAARASHMAGEHDKAVALLTERLRKASGLPATAEALLHEQLGCYLSAAGHERDAVAAHAEAVSLLPADGAGDAHARASVLAGHARALEEVGRYEESRDQARTALQIANDSGLGAVKARILPTLGFSLAYLGEPEAGLKSLIAGLKAARSTGLPDDIANAYVHLCRLLCGPLNRLAAGIDLGDSARSEIAELGLTRTSGVTIQAIVANAHFRLGNWGAASEAVEVALVAKPTGAAALDLRLALCRLLIAQGQFKAADRDLTVVETLRAQTIGPQFQVPLLTLRAGMAMFQGKPEEARKYVARGLGAAKSDDVWVLAPLIWHGYRAEADAATRSGVDGDGADMGQVQLLEDHLRGIEQRAEHAAPAVRASISAYRRLCDAETSRIKGHSDPALWEAAADAWVLNQQPYPAAYSNFRWAEALFAKPAPRAQGERRLMIAYREACRLGAGSLKNEIADLAKRARATLPGDTAEGVAAWGCGGPAGVPAARAATAPRAPRKVDYLTGREHQVLLRLGEGLTNRQIGSLLYISDKTVSVHVSRILAKLGVSSRTQAGLLAQQSTRRAADF
jgi:DNA-binding CsgD family transcriptional regulator/tetratricopeptide (TPR) repeat protein